MKIVDSYRYGRFDYASVKEVPDDGYIELPDTATSITVLRNGSGHLARFNVSTQSLRAWIEACRSRRPDLNRFPNPTEWEVKAFIISREPETMRIQQDIFSKCFRGTDWRYDPSMVELSVTLSDRGGGYKVWHVGSTGDTCIQAYYW